MPVFESVIKKIRSDIKDAWIQIADAEFTQEEKEETDKVYEVFLKLAGEDKEVDWQELKEILDYSMKDELKQNIYYKKDIKSINAAAPPSSQTDTLENDNFFIQLLGLICGNFCKDTPLAEMIPKPTQNAPLLTTFADLNKDGFSKDICRSMIAMMDVDRSGKLGYEEFKALWVALRNWKNVWTLYDTDRSGTFSGFELRQALQSAGYLLNNRILNALMHRYGSKNGEIQFDDFMMCAIKIKTMMDIFKAKNQSETDIASFTIEEWMEITLYT